MTTIAKRIPDAILTRAAKVADLNEDVARRIVDDEGLTFSEYARSMDDAMRDQPAQRRIDVLSAMLGAWVRNNPTKATLDRVDEATPRPVLRPGDIGWSRVGPGRPA